VLVIAGLVALLAVLAMLATAAPSRADVIPGAITSIRTTAAHVDEGDQVTFTCTWAVPDGSRPGDTFDLTLPHELSWVGSRAFTLVAPDGSAVATAVVDEADHVTFTLADYAASHPRDLHGSCTFVTVYTTAGTGGEVDLDFQVGAEVIRVPVGTDEPCTSNCAGSRDDAGKDMWWLDPAQTTTRSVIWTPATRAGSTTVTITDVPAPGLALDCATVEAHIGSHLGRQGKLAAPYDDDTIPAAVTCTPEGLVVRWRSVPEGEYAEVRVNATVTHPAQSTYANAAVVSFDGRDNPVQSTVVRTDAGGTGTGQVPPSATTAPTTTAPTPTAPTPTAPTTTAPTPSPSTTTATRPTATSPTQTSPTQTMHLGPDTSPAPHSPTALAADGTPVLAHTGSDLARIASVASLLLLLGAWLLMATRRRGSHHGR
jgi:surface antigen